MKNLLFPFLMALVWLMLSCEPQPPPVEVVEVVDSALEEIGEKLLDETKEGGFEIVEFDGCEYIVYIRSITTNRAHGLMAHKGNCKSPIHIYRATNTISSSIDTLEVNE